MGQKEITILDVERVMRSVRSSNSENRVAVYMQATAEILWEKGLLGFWDDSSAFELNGVRDKAIRNFIRMPSRCRMTGMIVDLDDDQRRALAYVGAVIETLSFQGALDASAVKGPDVYTEVHEVNDEQSYGLSFTPQKD